MVKFEFLGKLKDRDGDGSQDSGGGGGESSGIPTDEVQQLSNQGYSQHEITEELRDRGYSYSDINKAMNRAVRDSTQQSGGMQSTGSTDQGGQDFGSTQQQTQQPAGGTGGEMAEDFSPNVD
ncbi:MAG: hypothetical protein SVU32_05390, partial [Candidatus Nanohaloarchaea archaeon]|nr:hypothetical protein [Candidatus Nanohaloarchaea archaeon]